MLVTRHHALPTLLVTPARGEDLVAAVASALAQHAVGNAWIVGHGTLDEVEVRDGETTRTFATPSRVVALHGRAIGGTTLVLSATVSRSTVRGPELLVGDVVRARAGMLEVMITPLITAPATEVGEARDHPSEGGVRGDGGDRDDGDDREVAPALERAAAKPAIDPTSPWGALAKASAEAAASPVRVPTRVVAKPASPPTALPTPAAPVPPRRIARVEEETYPDVGDVLDHFAFGRCVVLRSDGDELLVQNPTSGRTRTIRLSALQQHGPFDEEGKRLYRLTQRRGA